MFDLSAHTALVTGAGQGVGVGIARVLAHQGASVAVNDVALERAEAVAGELRRGGARAVAAGFDVTDPDAVTTGVAELETELGMPVDILVNNAGVPVGMTPAKFRDMEPGAWAQYVDLNLYGSLHCIHAVIDGMAERRWGRVIQISSGAGRSGLAFGVSLYGASKSAAEGFIRHLAQEVARRGITANSIALGLMDNAIPEVDADTADVLSGIARQVPVGRLGTPEDVGAAVAFVASDEASWLTGQTIDLNGGQTTH
ncbi:MAG TPA: SDR family NAD(P)-dependent oxidoreductase [Acidimicrobiia bacterium]|nr:SDR family NAD(P)-dependent oxidoreductase [Acidimicrobiia bacterium]